MNSKLLLAAAALVWLGPVQATAQSSGTVAESAQPRSTVSVLVEPQLSDERLVLKIAAQNRSGAPIEFGPSNLRLAQVDGQSIALYPLKKLIEEVRLAAGMSAGAPGGAPTSTAYSSPQLNVRDGRVDVTGYTGGSAVARDEIVRRTKRGSEGKKEPTLSVDEANRQVAALQLAILQQRTLAPWQVAAGQIVTEPLRLKKGEDRTIHLWVRLAGDEHSFTLAAPIK